MQFAFRLNHDRIQQGMSSLSSSPQTPLYRITLFYGPELVDSIPKVVRCVFNVKKRSWKGGVQIVVTVEESQLVRVGETLHFEEWLETILAKVPNTERSGYTLRAHDLLGQQICYVKLELAIQHGIHQENSTLASHVLVQELDATIVKKSRSIKEAIFSELDVEELGPGMNQEDVG